jgi:hypothetical protein
MVATVATTSDGITQGGTNAFFVGTSLPWQTEILALLPQELPPAELFGGVISARPTQADLTAFTVMDPFVSRGSPSMHWFGCVLALSMMGRSQVPQIDSQRFQSIFFTFNNVFVTVMHRKSFAIIALGLLALSGCFGSQEAIMPSGPLSDEQIEAVKAEDNAVFDEESGEH